MWPGAKASYQALARSWWPCESAILEVDAPAPAKTSDDHSGLTEPPTEVPPKCLAYRSCKMIKIDCLKVLHFRGISYETISYWCNCYEMAFNLPASSYLRWVSCRQSMLRENRCFLSRAFSPFTFSIMVDRVECKSAIFSCVFHLSLTFIVPLFFLSCLLLD